MKRHIRLFTIIAIALSAMVALCGILLSAGVSLPWWSALIALLICAVSLLVLLLHIRDFYSDCLQVLANTIDPEHKGQLERFPLPVLLLDSDGAVLYTNTLFTKDVMENDSLVYGTPVATVFPELSVESLPNGDAVTMDLTYGGKQYTAFVTKALKKGDNHYVVYLVDDTRLKLIEQKYLETRPVVLEMCVDNLKEVTAHLGSRATGVRTQISGQIETMIGNTIASGNGLVQKYGDDCYVVVTTRKHLDALIEQKFPILQDIHEITMEGDDRHITMSIGVGTGENMGECRARAEQILDNVLKRGGDQAAYTDEDGKTQYVGGHMQTGKQRNKVQARINAQILKKEIENSDLVFIMGHVDADLDSIGSAVGLASIVRKCGREAYVCVNPDNKASAKLIQYLKENGKGDWLIAPDKARALVTENSLFIAVDNQTIDRLDDPTLFEDAKSGAPLFHRVVVIDHHPQPSATEFRTIQTEQLLYLDNDASSTCELVTEMLPYLSKEEIDRVDAEALLAGMILDTGNFVVNTGELTFDAASYLRSRNASMVAVRKLFLEDIEFYQLKGELVCSATPYRDMVIAVSERDFSEYWPAAAQVADDILLWTGKRASFVVARVKNNVKISARSLGEGCNVSNIMLKLGGGGHNNSAAAVLQNTTAEQAREQLIRAINSAFYGEDDSKSDEIDSND